MTRLAIGGLYRLLIPLRYQRGMIRRLLIMLFLCATPPALASTPGDQAAALCEWAATEAAAEYGVPPDILGALTLTETGRRRDGLTRPWAWSVNAEGEGSWFDDPNAALAFAESRVAQGRLNVDIGCFQLNYRWHGQNFASVGEMFDPLNNARYAARFVRDLHRETGDWRRAAGAFHSRTPKHSSRYLARFDELRAMLQDKGFEGMQHTVETYNRFASASPQVVAALPQPSRRARIVEKRMLLGAPEGTPVTGMPGSLAAIGGRRVALLTQGGPLIGGQRWALFGPGAREVAPRSGVRRPTAPAPDLVSPDAPAAPGDLLPMSAAPHSQGGI